MSRVVAPVMVTMVAR